ncbi:C45 family autoproteolytic acyltransferase/hydolase [Flavobacterium columnare]|uniref:Acyl-CoA--6-aminopenicillanic acid acyl-transferase n=1 Tax=Flavobacterium columnare TaxID=996 RepID=A0AAI8GBI0_9FLAO|nr:C45 family peptidase [Flavobacterium columnare]AMO20990.1 acyl-CoA--6-aminopenicillanic acid acyl-transferase [Flavobacterium columnare]AUX18992.1 acyl-CoA--6-aminopenicillanic acid acyl-transferase [Flavobacterium columnare]QOG58070.1 acyl-CoA--6-aminopenicillanic acid acyl-transferase [Flavobacterium columnare]QOG60792.1 acyl-CoA--6-aminopenicillanic acid acyl-transferase [Flavobacterium columnare]QOG63512.1 acyl-CoA--6-aminopenicillanic acid acyl-transferase [Flavobacterium columnare]
MNNSKKHIGTFFVILIFYSCGIHKSVHHLPLNLPKESDKPAVIRLSDTLVTHQQGYLVRNAHKIWELHIQGNPSQLGLLSGALAENLVKKQERIFFNHLGKIVPSKFKQKLLRTFLKWYNRKLYLNIKEEYKTEIYGVSQYTDTSFNYMASPYLRSLYLHGAHDIGHAVQDLALIGCTSLAVWGNKTMDGELLIGRNLDFYAGDDFAEDKVISFVNPEKGIPFASVSWAGMIGVLSGMNKEGLTVTINAGKSKMPLVAKTPISLLTREILQYATTIDEAIKIAKQRPVFVSESILVSSAKDKKAVIIEVSPNNFGVYEVQNTNQLVCSNHFQSSSYQNDKRNIKHIKESHSLYRMERIQELLANEEKMTPEKIAQILRNKEGLKEGTIGYGNEKAINQLLAHHAVIFKPESRIMWVSSSPYQLGAFVAYDLNKVFDQQKTKVTHLPELTIAKDSFLDTKAYVDYQLYRKYDKLLDKTINEKETLTPDFIRKYQELNPKLWSVYYKLGVYQYSHKLYTEALHNFEKALTLEITTLLDRNKVQNYLKKTKKKLS